MTREEAANIITKYILDIWMADGKSIKDVPNFNIALEMAIKALQKDPCGDTGEISDGYHTFNQLYHQRAILFAAIVNQNADIAWKSYKHSDGKYCFDSNGEWFIVGIDTPAGSYTYHYSKEYWVFFKCKELECGKEWDGHTEEDVIRLLSLKQYPCGDVVSSDVVSRLAVLDALDKNKYSNEFCVEHHIDWSINLGMAHIVVNELKSVAPQPCDDAISRKAVLEITAETGALETQARVKALPSVTPQPR